MMQLDATQFPSARGPDCRPKRRLDRCRSRLGSLSRLTLGVLVLGATIPTQASAEPTAKHGHYREQPDRGYHDSRDLRSSRPAQPPIRYQGNRYDPRQDHRGSSAYRSHDHYAPGHRYQPAPARGYQPRHGYGAAPSYDFDASERAFLRQHYRSSLRSVSRERRPYFAPGHTIAPAYRPYVETLPSHYRRHLPPPPRGYQVGYYEGYSVVYDPLTFTIFSVLDLMTR